ncbi:spore coat assembly protein SafA/uncharacterized protein, YkwD family [Clostridium sp. USBA 49]|jgi:uncharacterized YkwD family protein/spore coat assembly protein SafA|uniref:SafA/ExsA family spore coat assembly protein n=1 Tax=Clostridium TaxID=1485 RepID=UPI00099A3F5A|nr:MULTISPECIES: SafA/ExsA family spore coat assembly protein [Clostridium]SKA72766.1 spore coat assembly protein SafA/uncharacterized protein, YkwD family [Clostridium sp. USBA 49]
MKKIYTMILTFAIILSLKTIVNAQDLTYIVKPNDSMWKIAVKHQIGLSEIIHANPQIKNPNLIYPGQKLTVPNIDDIKKMENEVIRLVNVERTKRGLAPLTANWELSRVARYKSQDMKTNGYFSHNSPTYGSPFQMMQHFGIIYKTAGENIAMGQKTPAEVMQAWMNSKGHRDNILNPNFKEIGVGIAKDGNVYWTQMFISK